MWSPGCTVCVGKASKSIDDNGRRTDTWLGTPANATPETAPTTWAAHSHAKGEYTQTAFHSGIQSGLITGLIPAVGGGIYGVKVS